MSDLLSITVIVPAYNSQSCIAELIESLIAQDYPKYLTEIIIVDNNSTDDTCDIIKHCPVTLLHENDTQSSYAARNKGIQHATGDILAFTDADCIADSQWLSEGVSVLQSESADLAGGHVEFFYSDKESAAQLYDSITHIQMESNIKEKGFAPTANLLAKASAFDKVGMFPPLKSGGDAQWTRKAADEGLSLIYAAKAVVKHPARGLKELLKKRLRTGTGLPHIFLDEGRSLLYVTAFTIYRFVFTAIPVSEVKANIKRNRRDELNDKFLSILAVAYLCKLTNHLGTLIETIRILIGKLKK